MNAEDNKINCCFHFTAVDYLVDALKKVELRMSNLEEVCACVVPPKTASKATGGCPAPKAAAKDDDDDIDLFGSDDDEEADAVRKERYAEVNDLIE